MPFVFRCADFQGTLASVAAVLDVDSALLHQCLPGAVTVANQDPDDPFRALAVSVAEACGATVRQPDEIRYFHGTRTADAASFAVTGLRPLGDVLDAIWQQLSALAPELSTREMDRLREAMTAGLVDPHTYPLRVADARLHGGPYGHLVLEPLLHPRDYSSWDYLAGPEIIVDICQAIETRFAIDIASRYDLATRPCIVEFGMPADHLEGAIASALWYLEAASRGERTTNAHWGYDGCGRGVPAASIRDVTLPAL